MQVTKRLSHLLALVILAPAPRCGRCHHLHFTDRKAEALGSEVTLSVCGHTVSQSPKAGGNPGASGLILSAGPLSTLICPFSSSMPVPQRWAHFSSCDYRSPTSPAFQRLKVQILHLLRPSPPPQSGDNIQQVEAVVSIEPSDLGSALPIYLLNPLSQGFELQDFHLQPDFLVLSPHLRCMTQFHEAITVILIHY